MILWMQAALARDIDIKVHDMKGVLPVDTVVEGVLGEPGGAGIPWTCRDDGVAPDALRGDRLYTAHVAGLTLDHGTVAVRAAGRAWEGGFRFDAASDAVLLIGLEERGFAAASTREVVFVAQEPMAPAPSPGAAPPGAAPPPGGGAAEGLPAGMWLGWGIATGALAGLGLLARTTRTRPARIPPVLGGPAPRATTAVRGPYTPGERLDLWLGPARPGEPAPARIGEGRWSPEEVAVATARLAGPVRVVVSDPSRLDGGDFGALAGALAGVADLLWVDPG